MYKYVRSYTYTYKSHPSEFSICSGPVIQNVAAAAAGNVQRAYASSAQRGPSTTRDMQFYTTRSIREARRDQSPEIAAHALPKTHKLFARTKGQPDPPTNHQQNHPQNACTAQRLVIMRRTCASGQLSCGTARRARARTNNFLFNENNYRILRLANGTTPRQR